MSGFPGRSLRCSRNLQPIRCNTLRTRTSGPVFLDRMRPIISDRFLLLYISAMAVPAHNLPDRCYAVRLILRPHLAQFQSNSFASIASFEKTCGKLTPCGEFAHAGIRINQHNI
jgi:hypothetical protein